MRMLVGTQNLCMYFLEVVKRYQLNRELFFACMLCFIIIILSLSL